MIRSLRKQGHGDSANIPPGIDRMITQDGSCRYRVRIRLKGQKPISKNFKNLTHAKQWKRMVEGQIEQGLWNHFPIGNRHTCQDAISRYRKEILPNKIKDFRNVQRHLARWNIELGHIKLRCLSPSLIAQVRDTMLVERIRTGKTRSQATVKRYLATFSHVLTTAVREWQWLHENPCLKVKKPKDSPGRVRYLSRDELCRLLEACKNSSSSHLYLIFLIALTSGARKSEILGLRGRDIDLDNRLFHLVETKNGERRSLPISDGVFELLKERSLQRDLLIFSSGKNALQGCCIRSAWKRALNVARIQDFRFHDVRHTTASYLAMEGSSLREIAEILGHKTLQMTKRYSHLSQEHKRKLVDRIERIIHEEAE